MLLNEGGGVPGTYRLHGSSGTGTFAPTGDIAIEIHKRTSILESVSEAKTILRTSLLHQYRWAGHSERGPVAPPTRHAAWAGPETKHCNPAP